MNDGTVDAYAATKPSNGREIPLAVEASQFARVRFVIDAGGAALVRNQLTDDQAFAPRGMQQIGDILAALAIWTAPGKRTDYPQRLSHFLQ